MPMPRPSLESRGPQAREADAAWRDKAAPSHASYPVLGTGGSVDYTVDAAAPTRNDPPGLQTPTPRPWRGAAIGDARIEPRPFGRYVQPHPASGVRPDALVHLRVQPRPAARCLTPHAPLRALTAASAVPPSAPGRTVADANPSVWVWPSYALQVLPHLQTRQPAISAPLRALGVTTHARLALTEHKGADYAVFAAAASASAGPLAHMLARNPEAVAFWHPEGYSLLHQVVRRASLTHLQLVLENIGRLPTQARTALLDGVASDGRDAVRCAIDGHKTFALDKLLAAGCDPTRRRYRGKSLWFARFTQPLTPNVRIEDGASYAMRKRNVAAVDLLLLWDERNLLHLPMSRFAFDIEELMAIAMACEDPLMRDAMIEVLHAARNRRPSRYITPQIRTSEAAGAIRTARSTAVGWAGAQ